MNRLEKTSKKKSPHIFVFEGVNCSGKTFFSKLVETDLRLRKVKVKTISFPVSKKELKKFSDEKIKTQIIIRDFNRIYQAFRNGEFNEYDVLLFDRYIYSLLIYQYPLVNRDFFIESIKFCNSLKLSKTFFINTSEENIRERLEKRLKNNSEISSAEQKGVDYLLNIRDKYLEYAAKDPKRSMIIENSGDLRVIKCIIDTILNFKEGRDTTTPSPLSANLYENCERSYILARRRKENEIRKKLEKYQEKLESKQASHNHCK